MIAVIFEVEIAAGQKDAYLETAAELRERLEKIEGFISVERFQCLRAPNKLLSLSYWRDETAVQRWRQLAEHRSAHAGTGTA
ncbi:antibiotic biosynthesis monooxygenase, partial [Leisingera sp. ANG59]|uniref:antibiotic biosynthesis monooxygenase family protein n=1 Tax=Leisingera sp. ANG59 TaxID=2675221 RepID=UPI001571D8AD